ncbi:Response regulator MprA [compost metagenome]
MPVMDGAELCKQLRASARWQHLPVYVITADLSEQAAQRLADCGCQGHLDKPVLLKELAILLRTVSGRSSAPLVETSVKASPMTTLLNPALINLYLVSARQDLADIEGCVTAGNEGALNTALHKMKGAAKMVGAAALVQVIERWQRAPGHPLVEELQQAVEDVCRQLGERA